MLKNYLTLLALFCPAFFIFGQDNHIEQLMSKRAITYSDAGYNTALLIPRLYKENKLDTISELTDYIEKNFGSTAFIVPYIILSQIKSGTFKEEIKNLPFASEDSDVQKYSDSTYYELFLFHYLRWYRDNFDIIQNLDYPLYFRKAYSDYFDFLVSLSKDISKTPNLKPAEKWLLNYFIHPSDEQLKHAGDTEYAGTVLQKAWLAYHKNETSISGLSLSLVTGIWMPTGKLSVTGNHPLIGYTVGGRTDKFIYDLRMDFRFLRSPNQYSIVVDTFHFNTSYFFGFYVGLDGGYELFRHKKHAIELLGGIGWDYFGALSDNTISNYNLNSNAGTFSSLNLNTGLGYKFYYRIKTSKSNVAFPYLGLQAKYNFLFFNNNGGSDFHGGALTVSLVYGSYSRKINHYRISF